MRKKIVFRVITVFALACLISLTGCSKKEDAASAGESGEKKLKLRFSTIVKKVELDENNTPIAIGINTWIRTVEELSNGTIEIMLFPDGQIAAKTDQVVNGIQTGAFEVANFSTGNWAEFTNAFAELNVPYLYSDYDQAASVLQGEIGEAMIAQLEQDVPGVRGMAYLNIGFREMTNSKQVIKSPEDMKGMKIRTMNDKLQIAALQALGASATPMSFSELYGALQQGIVDGQENPLSTIYVNKFYEVNKYCTLTNHSYTTSFVFMNKDVYDSLSDNQRAAVEAANKACLQSSLEAGNLSEEGYVQKLTEKGMEVYKPTAAEMAQFRDKASASWGQAKDLMGDTRFNNLMDVLGI